MGREMEKKTKARRLKCGRAVTLLEVMTAMVVLAIAALGAVGYQYHAVQQTEVANAQVVSTRTAQLLLEDWKSTGGSVDYDPAILGLGFSPASLTPEGFSQGLQHSTGYILNDTVYAVTINNVPMLVMMTYIDVDYDSTAEVTLRELSIIITERDARNTNLDDHALRRKRLTRPISLTTYVRLDAASG